MHFRSKWTYFYKSLEVEQHFATKGGLKKICATIKEATPKSSWHLFASEIRVQKIKPPLSAANRAKRLAFAKKWMDGNICTLENVIWTDECRVASNPNNRRVSVWTNTGEVPSQVKMHSGGNSVMFWGCFSKHGTGNLVSLKGTMDGKEYVDVAPYARTCFAFSDKA